MISNCIIVLGIKSSCVYVDVGVDRPADQAGFFLVDDNPIPQHPSCPLFKFEGFSGNSVAAEEGGPEVY